MASTKVPIELSSTPGIVDNSNATAITIDSSENVGIGTSSPEAKLHVADNTTVIGNGSSGYATLNFHSSTTSSARYGSIRKNYDSPYDMRIRASNSDSEVPLIFENSNDSEAMRIDGSGNVGIGTSSPSSFASGGLTLGTTSSGKSLIINSSSNGGNGIIHFNNSSGNALQIGSGTNESYLYSYQAAPLIFYVNSAERMRIDSSGRVMINRTGYIGTGGANPRLNVSGNDQNCAYFMEEGSNGYTVAYFRTGLYTSLTTFQAFVNGDGVTIGSITTSNGKSGTSVSYNTTSDARLKENIVNAESQLETIKNIQVREFDWKTTNEHDIGVIAQELESVYPNAVAVGGDNEHEKPYSVDYSKLVVPLIKAVQEQQVLIEQLQAEVALLKGE